MAENTVYKAIVDEWKTPSVNTVSFKDVTYVRINQIAVVGYAKVGVTPIA